MSIYLKKSLPFLLIVIMSAGGRLLSVQNGAANHPLDQLKTSASFSPRILSSDASQITLEIFTPMPIVSRVEAMPLADDFYIINLPGYAQTAHPGEPQVPLLGFTLAVPPDAGPQLEVLAKQVERHRMPLLLPAPSFSTENEFVYDHQESSTELKYLTGTAYQQSRFFPLEHLQIGKTAVYRGQTLLTVQYMPVLYNPVTGQAAVCRSIQFRINFNKRTSAVAASEDMQDNLLKTVVLNASSLSSSHRLEIPPVMQANNILDQSSEWFKLKIQESGIYRIETEDLAKAGVNVRNLDLRRIGIFNRGAEIPIRVVSAAAGAWQEGDAFEFYAQDYKDFYNSENIYWFTPDGGGLRMEEINAAPDVSSPRLDISRDFIRQELDRKYKANFPGHTDSERWFMDSLYAPGAIVYPFALKNVVLDAQRHCTLSFRVQGFAGVATVSPNHHTQIFLNETMIYDHFWTGRVPLSESISFPSTLLKEGDNQLQFVGPGDTESFLDWILIDYWELDYWRKNQAENGMLRFSVEGQGTHRVQITEFSAADIFDIGDPLTVKRLINPHTSDGALVFQANLLGKHTFIALGDGQKKSPADFVRDNPSALVQSRRQCDYLVITVPDFFDAVKPLTAWHEQRGLTTELVDVQDIYDEFSYGLKSERAIKAFLTHAYHNRNTPAPRYVLLVGDASWNPRRLNPHNPVYGGNTATDIVPTRFFESSVDQFEVCSDNWFACVDGEDDVLPDMLVGRLPARSAAEVDQMVEKIIAYHRASNETPMRRAAFVADIGEGGTLAFEDSSSSMIRRFIPEMFTAERIYLSELGISATNERIRQIFGHGALTMNYFGHGSTGTWSAKTIFSRADVPSLPQNADAPFVFTMSCINGFFADPNEKNSALAEVLVNQDGRGAIGAFSGSGKAFPSPLFPLANTLYESLYRYGNTTLGSFCTVGLFSLHAFYPNFEDHVRFYILFGDPACPLRYETDHLGQFAGFSGKVRLGSERSLKGWTLQLQIKGDTVEQTLLRSDDGTFGPLYIAADDPATLVREGGVAGDTVKFYLFKDDQIPLYPDSQWLPKQMQTLSLSDMPTLVAKAPSVEFFINGRRLGDGFANGDPLPKNASVQVLLIPADGSSCKTPTLIVNNEPLDLSQYAVQTEGRGFRILFSPAFLPDGDYEMRIEPEDDSARQTWGSLQFRVVSRLGFTQVVNYPNPCTDQTTFTYLLENDRTALATIRVYTVSGRLISVIANASGAVGYNETPWLVQDTEGQPLSNGVYFYKVTVDDGEERAEVVERLVVMR